MNLLWALFTLNLLLIGLLILIPIKLLFIGALWGAILSWSKFVFILISVSKISFDDTCSKLFNRTFSFPGE